MDIKQYFKKIIKKKRLTIGTFNILASYPTFYIRKGMRETIVERDNRYNHVIRIILENKLDVYFLQEVDMTFYNLLMATKSIKEKYLIKSSYHDITFKRDVLIILLNKQSFVKGKNINFDKEYNNRVQLVLAKHVSGYCFAFGNVHPAGAPDLKGKLKRRDQLKELLYKMMNYNYVKIIGGDFNETYMRDLKNEKKYLEHDDYSFDELVKDNNLKIARHKTNVMTSYHPHDINNDGEYVEEKNQYRLLDYFLISKFVNKYALKTIPNFKGKGIEDKRPPYYSLKSKSKSCYINKQQENCWPSDHAMVQLTIPLHF